MWALSSEWSWIGQNNCLDQYSLRKTNPLADIVRGKDLMQGTCYKSGRRTGRTEEKPGGVALEPAGGGGCTQR